MIPALAAERYRLRSWRSDCWTAETTVEAGRGDDPTHVQMRRLADLQIHVTAPNGLPVQGLHVHLTSAEFGEEVADWIAQERVHSEGLVTDLHGRIHVDRVPHGTYRWRITRLEGNEFEGEFTLEPGDETPVLLRLPE